MTPRAHKQAVRLHRTRPKRVSFSDPAYPSFPVEQDCEKASDLGCERAPSLRLYM